MNPKRGVGPHEHLLPGWQRLTGLLCAEPEVSCRLHRCYEAKDARSHITPRRWTLYSLFLLLCSSRPLFSDATWAVMFCLLHDIQQSFKFCSLTYWEPLQLMVFTLSKTKQANKQKQLSKQRWQQWQSLGIHSCLEGNLMVSYIMSFEESKSYGLTSRTFDLSICDMWPGVKGHVLDFLTCSVMKCFQKTHYKTDKYMGISGILVSKLLWFYQIYLKIFK